MTYKKTQQPLVLRVLKNQKSRIRKNKKPNEIGGEKWKEKNGGSNRCDVLNSKNFQNILNRAGFTDVCTILEYCYIF